MQNELIVGIDATNIRGGGGLTHLIELLNAACPQQHDIKKVVVWGGENTVSMLPERSWLLIKSPKMLNKGVLNRVIWQLFGLSRSVRNHHCDVLFVPGGSYSGSFKPVVTMSQNLLPFDNIEIRRFGISKTTLRLLLLRIVQSRTFRISDGIIFLTKYAQKTVEKFTGRLNHTTLVSHGISNQFYAAPKKQLKIGEYSDARPFKVLYVSIVNQYKHQWHVISAIAELRNKYGYPIELTLVGPSFPLAMKKLQKQIEQDDPCQQWVKYHGAISHDSLGAYYSSSDLGVFASSCENLPITLLEKMASGLPIACSCRGPMPEVLSDAGLYFDPEDSSEISCALKKIISSPELRYKLAQSSYKKAQIYSWELCASKTFGYLAEIAKNNKIQTY